MAIYLEPRVMEQAIHLLCREMGVGDTISAAAGAAIERPVLCG
jgi:hypothetical protein